MSKIEVIPDSQEIGVIIPPSHIRNEINTTAKYVAKYGINFEKRIIEKESNNPKFSFINRDDPYRAYYDQRVFIILYDFLIPGYIFC